MTFINEFSSARALLDVRDDGIARARPTRRATRISSPRRGSLNEVFGTELAGVFGGNADRNRRELRDGGRYGDARGEVHTAIVLGRLDVATRTRGARDLQISERPERHVAETFALSGTFPPAQVA